MAYGEERCALLCWLLCRSRATLCRYGEYLATALPELHAAYLSMWPAAVRVFCSVSSAF
jgi:hypothetical protein